MNGGMGSMGNMPPLPPQDGGSSSDTEYTKDELKSRLSAISSPTASVPV